MDLRVEGPACEWPWCGNGSNTISPSSWEMGGLGSGGNCRATPRQALRFPSPAVGNGAGQQWVCYHTCHNKEAGQRGPPEEQAVFGLPIVYLHESNLRHTIGSTSLAYHRGRKGPFLESLFSPFARKSIWYFCMSCEKHVLLLFTRWQS